MLQRAFWTERRFTGLLLILGCMLFLAGAGFTPTDRKGTFIYGLPLREQLLTIAVHQQTWQWGILLLISGTVILLFGLAMLSMVLRDMGNRTFSQLGLITFELGTVLVIIDLAFRLSIEIWAAQEATRTRAIPGLYLSLTPWVDALFRIYTVLAFSTLALYGAALVSTRMLPRWIGWTAIVYALVGLMLLVFTGDVPPFLHQLLPIVIGILLLLRRYQVPQRSLHQEKPVIVETLVGKREV